MSEAQHKSQGIIGLSLMVQIGETPNPELRIITSTFNKVLYRGDYNNKWSYNYRNFIINFIIIIIIRIMIIRITIIIMAFIYLTTLIIFISLFYYYDDYDYDYDYYDQHCTVL